MWLFYISFTLVKVIVYFIMKLVWMKTYTTLLKKQRCQHGGCVKAVNIQYHMSTTAAHIKSLGEMRQEHGLTYCTFTQLYINKLADTVHVFNIKSKHAGNITLFLPL